MYSTYARYPFRAPNNFVAASTDTRMDLQTELPQYGVLATRKRKHDETSSAGDDDEEVASYGNTVLATTSLRTTEATGSSIAVSKRPRIADDSIRSTTNAILSGQCSAATLSVDAGFTIRRAITNSRLRNCATEPFPAEYDKENQNPQLDAKLDGFHSPPTTPTAGLRPALAHSLYSPLMPPHSPPLPLHSVASQRASPTTQASATDEHEEDDDQDKDSDPAVAEEEEEVIEEAAGSVWETTTMTSSQTSTSTPQKLPLPVIRVPSISSISTPTPSSVPSLFLQHLRNRENESAATSSSTMSTSRASTETSSFAALALPRSVLDMIAARPRKLTMSTTTTSPATPQKVAPPVSTSTPPSDSESASGSPIVPTPAERDEVEEVMECGHIESSISTSSNRISDLLNSEMAAKMEPFGQPLQSPTKPSSASVAMATDTPFVAPLNPANPLPSPPTRRRGPRSRNFSPAEKELISVNVQRLHELHRAQLAHLAEQQSYRLTTMLAKLIHQASLEKGAAMAKRELVGPPQQVDEKALEAVVKEIETHQNQIRYLKMIHSEELRKVRAGDITDLSLLSSTSATNSGPAAVSSSTLTTSTVISFTELSAMTSSSTRAAEQPFEAPEGEYDTYDSTSSLPSLGLRSSGSGLPVLHEYTTPVRSLPVDMATSNTQLVVNYYSHWVTESELDVITKYHFIPAQIQDISGKVKWERVKHEALLSPQQFSEKAFRESIEDFPHVYVPSSRCPKTAIAARALANFVKYNPTAVGMCARRELVAEMNIYYKLTGRTEKDVLPIEVLLEEVEQGNKLRRSWRWFPPTRNRIPFRDFETARIWLHRILGNRIKENFIVPTLADFRAACEAGRAAGGYYWYDSFHDLILEACQRNIDDQRFFLSLLATASPNSSIPQNVINALLNFRALSQGKRPKNGSYPMRSLINYLAGTQGCPSGNKIICFLDNLLFPKTSPCVTVDTHMQGFLLGSGRMTFSPVEYAVVEDFYRMAAKLCTTNADGTEEPPHRFQASIWVTVAGPLSFTDELMRFAAPIVFYLPTVDRIADESAREIVKNLLDPTVAAAVVSVLRRKLLRMGYLTLTGPSLQLDLATNSVTLQVFVPIREDSAEGVRNHMTLRRTMAKKQNRQLTPAEEAEMELMSETLLKISRSETGKVQNEKDLRWWRRDYELVRAWMASADQSQAAADSSLGTQPAADVSTADEAEPEDEADPYYRSHVHFQETTDSVQSLLPQGGFIAEVAAELAQRRHGAAPPPPAMPRTTTAPPAPH